MDYLAQQTISKLGNSKTELSEKNIRKIHQVFPIPREQKILWADVIFNTRSKCRRSRRTAKRILLKSMKHCLLLSKVCWEHEKMRALNEKFVLDLKNGELKQLLQAVQLDDTLCLEIRENYINIYYRGGNILRVKQKRNKYDFEFDFNYCIHKAYPSKYNSILRKNKSISDWVNSIPYIKAEMDLWFHESKNTLEREYQQVILRDNNNSSISGDTDYFIADIEYANSEYGCRFDLLGIKWPSNSVARKDKFSPTLAIMELKYGDGALSGSAGIRKHFADIHKFFSNAITRKAIYIDTETMFNQKVELGLIQGTEKQIKINSDERPEFILIFANHKPVKTVLLRELRQALLDNPDIVNYADIKIASASCVGYGLYIDNMMDINQFISSHQEKK